MTFTIIKSCSDDKTKPHKKKKLGEELLQEPNTRKTDKEKEAKLLATSHQH